MIALPQICSVVQCKCIFSRVSAAEAVALLLRSATVSRSKGLTGPAQALSARPSHLVATSAQRDFLYS